MLNPKAFSNPSQVKMRANHLMDRDMRMGRSDAWGEVRGLALPLARALHERFMWPLADMCIAHLQTA